MMLRKVAIHPAMRRSALWRPTPARALTMKAPEPVVDKEAEQEQMEQLSKQMEDSIVKEKQVQALKQASKNHTWDSPNESVRIDRDEPILQSRSHELDNIEKEQAKLLEQEVSSLPGGSEKLQTSNTKTVDEMNNKITGKGGVMDKVMDSVTKTKERLKETFPGVHKTGHDIKESTKATMEGSVVKTKEMLKDAFPGVHEAGHEIKETTKESMEDLKEMAKASMTSSNQDTTDPNIRHDTKVTQAGDPEVPKPKSKQFSENKQNSSLL